MSRSQLQQALLIVNTSIAQQQLLTSSLTMVAMDNRLSSYVVPRDLVISPIGDQQGLSKRISLRKSGVEQFRRGVFSDPLWLLGYDQFLAMNVQKFIVLAELYPEIWDKAKPLHATTWGAQPGSKPYAAIIQDLKAQKAMVPSGNALPYVALDSHYCPEAYSWNLDFHSEYFIGCFRTGPADPYIFRFMQMMDQKTNTFSRSFVVPLPPEFQTEFQQPIPQAEEIDPKSESLNVPALSPELMVLFRLKQLLLSALDGYTGFEGLRDDQKCLAINLMIKDAEAQ